MKNIPSRVYIRYGLLSIPGTVVLILILIIARNWVPIPIWLQATLVFLWIAKEAILFPSVWRAYDPARSEVSRPMIGARGLTRQRLAPAGYIQVQGELWKAEKMPEGPPIEKDERVRVIKRQGLKLFVVSEEEHDRRQTTRGQMKAGGNEMMEARDRR